MKKRLIISTVVSVFILAVALATGSVLMLRLFSISVLVPLFGFLWTFPGARGITGHVNVTAERFQAGRSYDEEITVHSNSRLPKMLVKVEPDTDLPADHESVLVNLRPNGTRTWQTKVHCRRRGRYTLGKLKATVTDPFGLFTVSRSLGRGETVTVYPATIELPFFSLMSRNQSGGGASRWLVSEMGGSAARVREYAGGDTLNRIHWQSTAHTGTLMVKEFDADNSNFAPKSIWIVLDMQQDVQAGDGGDSTEEMGVIMAASVMKKYIENGQQVGLITSGDQHHLFAPEAGTQHMWKMMDALAVTAAAGSTPVEQLLAAEAGRFTGSSVVIVITPSASQRLAAPLRAARRRGAQIILVSLDSSDRDRGRRSVGLADSMGSNGQVYVVRRGDISARLRDAGADVSRRAEATA